MTVDRLHLLSVLKSMAAFTDASPYVGLKLANGKVYAHRSGEIGYIQTEMYDKVEEEPVVASLAHLITCLGALTGKEVTLSRDKSGILGLVTSDASLNVFTLRPGIVWSKEFTTGDTHTHLPAHSFANANLVGYTLVAPPILGPEVLVLPTLFGVVRIPVKLGEQRFSPREDFLRVLGPLPTHIMLTTKGYWKALTGGFDLCIAGHSSGAAILRQYNVPSQKLVDFPVVQFLTSQDCIRSLCGEDDQIHLRPGSMSVSNSMGTNTFSLKGDNDTWPAFNIHKKLGSLFMRTLTGGSGDIIQLSRVSSTHLRLSRGFHDVTFIAR